MFAVPASLAGAAVIPVAVKAVGELHRLTVLQSNVLSRQGNGVPKEKGEGEKLARQRASGVKGGIPSSEPQYMGSVPNRKVTGDLRKDYQVGGLGNATSSRGNITDILEKVPQQILGGTADYKRAARPVPARRPGFGNQSYTP